MELKKNRLNQAGMTLIEIIVVIAMIGGIMALGGVILFPGNDAKLKEVAIRLAGSIQYVYNEAAIKNKYYRYVFDLNTKSYYVESSLEPFIVSTEAPPETTVIEQQEELALNPIDQAQMLPTSVVTEINYFVNPIQLPDGIKIKDITVLHLPERQETGIVHAYFLPNGWVEPMIINLSDENEEYFYSLEVNPLTGKTKIREEYYEADPKKFNEENPLNLETQ